MENIIIYYVVITNLRDNPGHLGLTHHIKRLIDNFEGPSNCRIILSNLEAKYTTNNFGFPAAG